MDDVVEAVSRATATRLEYRNVSPGELRDILIAVGMDTDHASFEPTPLAQVIAAAA
jgi:hypothetical protein